MRLASFALVVVWFVVGGLGTSSVSAQSLEGVTRAVTGQTAAPPRRSSGVYLAPGPGVAAWAAPRPTATSARSVSSSLAGRDAYALPFPYHGGHVGLRIRSDGPPPRSPGPSTRSLLDLGVGYALDDVFGGRVSMRGRIGDIFDVGIGAFVLVEPRQSGTPALGLMRATLGFAVVRDPQVLLRLLVDGGMYVAPPRAFEGGADARVELDAYPVQPLVLAASAAIGWIGHALLLEAEATLGAQVDAVELYAGYRVLAFVGAASAVLHGPILGVRIWIS
jgi:hypothetical protein